MYRSESLSPRDANTNMEWARIVVIVFFNTIHCSSIFLQLICTLIVSTKHMGGTHVPVNCTETKNEPLLVLHS